ncbi:helix-turn-helix domain-containing protein [Streptomyces sp. GQFP]|uniref:helix-turn-helix domain-containing protein n=1 Tax=Streptomyces sp. GQFP TaxID=2907545 RepID=UPI001F45981E|nr:Scr1 family TA system antitoxin-like transcriptional regulator [Streptomyces sp. GQFP]UIX32546.1 Scr1 family TA system antitoxin-like transcriptional regulator [Streptomyces sp. GQFP]
MVCSPSLIAHYEAGRRTPSLVDAERIDQALGTDGFFTRWRSVLAKVRFAAHFQEAAEAEQLAVFIEEYAVAFVPGLLQTKAYARAVLKVAKPNSTAAELDKKVVNRLERARILEIPETPTVWMILAENVIRTMVGGPAVMAEQLRHMVELGRSGRVMVQVVPFSAGAHPVMDSNLKLMRFADAPDMAYVESLHTGSLTDEPNRWLRTTTTMSAQHITDASTLTAWRKSSHSGSDNGNCLEVSEAHPTHTPVRDSKNPTGPALLFGTAAWSTFVASIH